ncbi:hypothetical protein ACFW0U_15255, partial [Streptomyces albidoflavus]
PLSLWADVSVVYKSLGGPAASARVFSPGAFDSVDARFYISTTRLNGKDDAAEKLMLAYAK